MNPASDTERHRLALEPLRLPGFAPRDNSRPFVIALEGPNGAGKTTLCRLLSQTLGVPACLGTDEAWFSDSFKTRMIHDAEWFASAMFFLSGCFEQMRVLRQRDEPLIIMDRSLWSTLAVHGADRAERLGALVAMLEPIAREIQAPDLTIVVEASFETCKSRIDRKSGLARLLDSLTANPAFHARERQFYHWLARERSEVLFVDASESPVEKIAERAAAMIRQNIPAESRGHAPGGDGKSSVSSVSS